MNNKINSRLKDYRQELRYLDTLIAGRPKEFQTMITDRNGIKDYTGGVGINRVAAFLNQIGNPQDSLNIIHVGGTSGKGSTCIILNNILTQAGYNTGLHVSPHLTSPIERICFNNKFISIEEFVSIVQELRKEHDRFIVEADWGMLSYFEFTLAMAFLYFRRKQSDIVILEVGMGGTLDGTNVIKSPLASVITNIELDHTERLGNTKEEIARDKSGIIKQGSIFITGEKEPGIAKILSDKANDKNTESYISGKDFTFDKISINNNGISFDFKSTLQNIDNLTLNSLANYQIYNSCLAIFTLLKLSSEKMIFVKMADIENGLKTAKIPARFEIFKTEGKKVLIDGAHNPDKTRVLSKTMHDIFGVSSIIYVLGFTGGRDLSEILKPLCDNAKAIVATSPLVNGRSIESPLKIKETIQSINEKLPVYINTNPFDALKRAMRLANDTDIICVTGSLYLAGNIRELWFDEDYVINNRTMF